MQILSSAHIIANAVTSAQGNQQLKQLLDASIIAQSRYDDYDQGSDLFRTYEVFIWNNFLLTETTVLSQTIVSRLYTLYTTTGAKKSTKEPGHNCWKRMDLYVDQPKTDGGYISWNWVGPNSHGHHAFFRRKPT